MMISEKMNTKLNEQITAELYSSHLYLAMASAFEGLCLRVFAKFYYKQAEEERDHAMKIFKYVIEQGGKVVMGAIDQPKGKFGSAQAIVEAARDHEVKVTKMIHDLVALAENEKDYATRSFLKWFVDEQVEEVATQEEILNLVKMAGPQQLLPLEHRISQMVEG